MFTFIKSVFRNQEGSKIRTVNEVVGSIEHATPNIYKIRTVTVQNPFTENLIRIMKLIDIVGEETDHVYLVPTKVIANDETSFISVKNVLVPV